jgi:nitroreductase
MARAPASRAGIVVMTSGREDSTSATRGGFGMLRLRGVEPALIQECLELAIQAPNGGNQNRYHFVVITDPVKRAAIGAIYKKVFYQEHAPLSRAGNPGLPVYQQRSATQQNSASYLAARGIGF